MKIITAIILTLACFLPTTAYADMQGIDVSGWQPSNITRLVNADLAVVKVSQGTGYINNSWKAQAQGAVDTGKALGLYHYASGSDATSEADYFLAQIGGYVGRSVLVLDWESNQNSQWGNGAWVWTFVKRIHDRTNVWPLVYVQASAIGQIPQIVWNHCGLWVAQYASMLPTGYQSNPWNYGRYGEAMRQYASTGRLPGYNGNLDLNVFRGDINQWNAYAHGDGAVPVQPSQPNTSTGNDNGSGVTKQCVTVKSGDSLSSIAAQYGGVWSDWTGYRSGNPGLIYAGETVCRGAATTTGANTGSGITSTAKTLTVTVKSSDTISAIASRYNAYPLTAWSVPSGDINRIWPGQIVTYHGSTVTTSMSSASGHVVKSGENLWSIYGTGWVAAAQRNGLTAPYIIYPGQILR